MISTIRKFIAALTVSVSMSVCGAEPYFCSAFDANAEIPLDGWLCHGAGKTAKTIALGSSFGLISSYFPEGSEAYRVLSFPGAEDAAYSNSTTVEGGKVDEWLVSPVIPVPAGKNALILQFDEISIGSIRPGDYDVCLSTGGTEPDDFTAILYSGRPKGMSNGISSKNICIPVNGYEGKHVRIAFVNRSNGTCLLGFTDVRLIDYHTEITSLIPEFTFSEGPADAIFDVSIRTPETCNGFVARFTADGESTQEYRTDSDLSKDFKSEIRFKAGLTLAFGQKKNYKLEIVPDDRALSPCVFEGKITCSEGFPGVCVMEEATGTWCPACVRGAAALAKYSDDYPEQFFGLAVHENDPMAVEAYNTPLKEESRISSFPSAWINRTVRDDPQKKSHIERFVTERLSSKVSVDKVFHFKEDGAEKLTVLYSPQLCYDTDEANLRAVAVISEDRCKGSSERWYQINGYSGATPESVGGEEWWPYFEFYSSNPEAIPASDMEYGHVAWGIYNDYSGSGSNISSTWEAYTPQQYSITFAVPYQEKTDEAGVQEISNTSVTVLLLDGKTGRVVGADRMEASGYIEGDPAGIDEIKTGEFKVRRNPEGIIVTGNGMAAVEVYDIAGVCIGKGSVRDGSCRIRAHECKYPLIIRITYGTNVEILKLR